MDKRKKGHQRETTPGDTSRVTDEGERTVMQIGDNNTMHTGDLPRDRGHGQIDPNFVSVKLDNKTQPLQRDTTFKPEFPIQRVSDNAQIRRNGTLYTSRSVQTVSVQESDITFREVRGQSFLQIGPNNTIVDIQLTRGFLDEAKKGGELSVAAGDGSIARLTWNGVAEAVDAVKTTWKMRFRNLMRDLRTHILRRMSYDLWSPLRRTIEDIFKKYGARMTEITNGSLVFVFCHADRASAEFMLKDKPRVRALFREMMERIGSENIDFNLHESLVSKSPSGTTLDASQLYDHMQLMQAEITASRRENAEMKQLLNKLIMLIQQGLRQGHVDTHSDSDSGGDTTAPLKESTSGLTELSVQEENISPSAWTSYSTDQQLEKRLTFMEKYSTDSMITMMEAIAKLSNQTSSETPFSQKGNSYSPDKEEDEISDYRSPAVNTNHGVQQAVTPVTPSVTEHVTRPVPADTENATHPVPSDTEHATRPVPSDTEHATRPSEPNSEHLTRPVPSDTEHLTRPVPSDTEHLTRPVLSDTEHLTRPVPSDTEYDTHTEPSDTENVTRPDDSETEPIPSIPLQDISPTTTVQCDVINAPHDTTDDVLRDKTSATMKVTGSGATMGKMAAPQGWDTHAQTAADTLSSPQTDREPVHTISPSAWTSYSTENSKQFIRGCGIKGASSEFTRLDETVGFALMDDEVMPPKAHAVLTTILCLDASESLRGDGFEEMKSVACQIVDGLNDVAERHYLEENISVVAFGGRSRIEHHISNDYGSVRESIENLQCGGRSPLFEALLVSLCAYQGRGGSISVAGVHRLQPRLIVITDGLASDATEHTAQDVDTVDQNVKMQLIQLMQNFTGKVNSGAYPNPVIWIPVGNANIDWLKSLANISGGDVCSRADIGKLCKYHRIQDTIGKTFAYIKKTMKTPDSGALTDDIKIMVDAFSGDLDQEYKAQVLETVKAKFEGKLEEPTTEQDTRSFDNIVEIEDTELPLLGSRVVRGSDWEYGNQDAGCTGTVINHSRKWPGWLWVMWDSQSVNVYRFGARGCFDVDVVEDQPKICQSAMMVEIGCQVTRGPDWESKYGDQDGGSGGVGVVVRNNKHGEVMVRWKLTHKTFVYRYGKDDRLDLAIRDPEDIIKELTQPAGVSSPSSHHPDVQQAGSSGRTQDDTGDNTGDMTDDSRWVWQWQDERCQWHLYRDEDILKLEKAYKERPGGSCVISRCGTSCRVIFKENIERAIGSDTKTRVQRTRMSEEDIVVVRNMETTGHYG